MPAMPDEYQLVTPGVAQGEDATVTITGNDDPTGWTLAAYVAYAPYGPPESGFSGVTLAASGTDLLLTLPAATTAAVTVERSTPTYLYIDLWRTGTGVNTVLARLKVPAYRSTKA